MTPGRYRRRLDELAQAFVKDAYSVISPVFRSSRSDAEILSALIGPLHRLISRHRVEIWTLADEFVSAQAREQGYTGSVRTPRLRRYSEGAVRTLLERRLELRGRDDDEGGIGRDSRQASYLVQSALRHVEAAGRSTILDLAKELERERREQRRGTPSTVRSSQDDDEPPIGSERAAQQQSAADAQGAERWRVESTGDADEFEAPMWARVLTGADNCPFCVMLASRPGTSRGDFYTSQWAALFTDLGNKYHDHCDCIAVPVFNPRTWAGRTQAEQLYDLWKTATTTTSSRPYDKEIGWDERVPALAEFRDYMAQEAAEGRDPLRDIVGDLRADVDGEDERDPIDTDRGEADRGTPVIDWRARQDALGLDFGDDRLEPHEIEFIEAFTALGNDVTWIPRDYEHNRPTNDFRWNDLGIDVELKRTSPKYRSIHRLINGAVMRAAAGGVVKANFMIDLGARPLTDRLRSQLEQYNARNPHRPIRRLFVFAAGVITEIILAPITG